MCVVRAAHSREHGHAREVHSAQHHINCCVCYYLQAHTEVCAAPDKDPSAGPAPVQSSAAPPACLLPTDGSEIRDSRALQRRLTTWTVDNVFALTSPSSGT